MNVKIKEFEKAAMEAVSGLRNELGAKSISIEIHVDKFEKCCRTDVSFYTSIPNASGVPGCGPACKAD